MAYTPLDQWALSINGRYIDRDWGAPAHHPWQCHDVWLSLLVDLLGLPVGWGHAPGVQGYTYEVWNQFPRHRPQLADHFTKHTGHLIQAGDVVFWPQGSRSYPNSHVVVALGPTSPVDGTILCVSQNPGEARIVRLYVGEAAGFLRPKAQWINRIPTPTPKPVPKPVPKPADKPAQKPSIRKRSMILIYCNDAISKGKGAWALTGPDYWLPITDRAEAVAVREALSGKPSPVVSKARWNAYYTAATGNSAQPPVIVTT